VQIDLKQFLIGKFHRRVIPYISKFNLTVAFIFASSLMFRILIPQIPRVDGMHDDFLMLQLADNLLNSNWLGLWDSTQWPILTLFKPPGYPMFLALAIKLNIPPAVLCFIIYQLGALFIYRYLKYLGIDRRIKLLTLIIILFNPAMFAYSSSIIYRDVFATALLMLSIGLSVNYYSLQSGFNKVSKIYQLKLSLNTILYSIVLSWAFLVKSDVFILVLLNLLITSLFLYITIRKHLLLRNSIFFIFIFTAPLIFTLGTDQLIKKVNYDHYGVRLIEDNSSGNYSKLLGVLASVKYGNEQPDFFITYDEINFLAEKGQSFKLLKPYFESNNIWKSTSCNIFGPCGSSYYFFQHELRDAIYSTGKIGSAADFQSFSLILSSEVKQICSVYEIDCSGLSILPNTRSIKELNKRDLINNFPKIFQNLINLDYVHIVEPTTLASDIPENRSQWLKVPGVIIDYKPHPLTGDSLNLKDFQFLNKHLFVLFNYLTLLSIFLLLFSRLKSNFISKLNPLRFFHIQIIILIFIEILIMALSDTLGWNSIDSASTYFIIFSPLQMIVIALTAIELNSILKKIRVLD
jgi:hypothetical protein